MKKIVALVLVLALSALAGCSSSEIYREPERQYLVSAMGFDRRDSLLMISLEVIIFSVGSAQSSIETRVFSGLGERVREALGSLSGEVSKLLLFSHCRLIVLGESLTPEQRGEVFAFCTPENDINITASVICSPDALELLSADSLSTPVTGYDITGVIKQKSQDWGIGRSERIYQIGDARLRGESCYALPRFTMTGEGAERMYSFGGIFLHRHDSPVLLLDLPDSALYSLLRGDYGKGGGSFFISTEGGDTLSPRVKRADTDVSGEYVGGNLRVSILCRLELDARRGYIGSPGLLVRALEERSAEFVALLAELGGADLLNIVNRVNIKGQSGARPDISEVSELTVGFEVVETK